MAVLEQSVGAPFEDASAGHLHTTGGLASHGRSAASWPAIFAGAVVAVSSSLILLALGSGLGLASISPWPGHGVSAKTFTVTMAIWLILTQWISAALGGYIAGRLRTKWVGTHTHEVFFRDTAHGLVTWSLATVLIAAALAGGARNATQAASAAAQGGSMSGLTGAVASGGAGSAAELSSGPSAALTYGIDRLFRPAPTAGTAMSGSPASGAESSDPRAEALYIVFNAMSAGAVPDADRAYLAELVQTHTGISGAEAQRRVDDFITATMDAEFKARAAADAARKGAAEASLFLALSMLIGAFIASVSAALGGRLRDEHI